MVEWTMPSPNGDQISFLAQAYHVPKVNRQPLSHSIFSNIKQAEMMQSLSFKPMEWTTMLMKK